MGLELDLPSGQSLEQRLFPGDLNDPVGWQLNLHPGG